MQAPLPVSRHVDLVALVGEYLGEHVREFRVVLDQKQPVYAW